MEAKSSGVARPEAVADEVRVEATAEAVGDCALGTGKDNATRALKLA